MGVMSQIVVLVVIWWILFFIILPLRNKQSINSQDQFRWSFKKTVILVSIITLPTWLLAVHYLKKVDFARPDAINELMQPCRGETCR